MIRRPMTRILLAGAALAALAGCSTSDSANAPAAFDVSTVFAADEAVVTGNDADINVRLIGLDFTGAASAAVAPSSRPLLDRFAEVYAHYADAQYSVQAHTDERGTAAYNLRFSQERADSVRSYLVGTVGLPADVEAVGYGEERPLDPDHTATAWAANRRVEVVITPAHRK